MKLEELALEDACQISATYDITQDFLPNTFIDVHDKTVWRVAQITRKQGSIIDVHYEAWSQKYDENNLQLNSIRVTPFRSHTVGYTGQPKCPYRDFQFSDRECLAYDKKLRYFMSKNFIVQDKANDINQFFRGSLFIYVDTLLTFIHFSGPPPEVITQVLSFCDLNFEFIMSYIKDFPTFKKEYELTSSFPFLYLGHNKAALALCYTEFAELLKLFLGVYVNRTSETFKVINQCNVLIVYKLQLKFY